MSKSGVKRGYVKATNVSYTAGFDGHFGDLRSNFERAAWLHYATGSSKLRIANADQKYQH